MCNAITIAVFFSEFTEYLPAMASKFFFSPFVIVQLAQIITGIISVTQTAFAFSE
jgi:hypothetical protein